MKPIKILTAMAMGAGIIGAAYAQDQAPRQAPPRKSTSRFADFGQRLCGALAAHIEGRFDKIKAELKITETQEPLWNSYAATAREYGSTLRALCAGMVGHGNVDAASLPDRLDKHEQLLSARLDAVRATNKT